MNTTFTDMSLFYSNNEQKLEGLTAAYVDDTLCAGNPARVMHVFIKNHTLDVFRKWNMMQHILKHHTVLLLQFALNSCG